MKIGGYQKVSLQDYPNKVSTIVFTQGCNLNCPYCHNSMLIPIENKNLIKEKEFFDYLETRKGILDGVVVTGGEPTIQKDLKEFIKKIKDMGFLVKLDTNGTNYSVLKDLVDNNLIDYVAMDIKNDLSKYGNTVGVNNLKTTNILKSIEFLKNSSIDHEFRTTIVEEYHTLNDILSIIKLVGDSKYYLQNFKDSEYVLNKNLTSFTDDKLDLWNRVLKGYPNVFIRGIEKR